MLDYETIRKRYLANYIRDDQLKRYVELGVITEAQYEALYKEKHGVEPGEAE